MTAAVVALDRSLAIAMRGLYETTRTCAAAASEWIAGRPDHDLVAVIGFAETVSTLTPEDLSDIAFESTFGRNLEAAVEAGLHALTGRVLFSVCSSPDTGSSMNVGWACSYPSDLTDEQWDILSPLLLRAGKRGPRFGEGLRMVANGMLYVSHTGCQWRSLPSDFGSWTRVWSQFRRWSRNGTWAVVVAASHEQARVAAGREASKPSMVVIDTHLARGAVAGLAAKAIIDIDVVVPSDDDVPIAIDRLRGLGYLYQGDKGIPGSRGFPVASRRRPASPVCGHRRQQAAPRSHPVP